MDYQPTVNQLYEDFNTRDIGALLASTHTDVAWPNGWEGDYVCGHNQVRDYWLRQWQQINPTVVPISFQVRPGRQIEVGVH